MVAANSSLSKVWLNLQEAIEEKNDNDHLSHHFTADLVENHGQESIIKLAEYFMLITRYFVSKTITDCNYFADNS